MDISTQLVSLCFIHLFAVASPGPDFFIVVKNSLKGRQSDGLLTTLGITLGNVFHLILAISVTSTILLKAPWFFEMMKIAGSGFLFYLGYKSIRSFKSSKLKGFDDVSVNSQKTVSPFIAGFVCCLLNVKAGLYYFSLFSQFLSHKTEVIKSSLTLGVCFLGITFSWFYGVSLLLRTAAIRRFLQNYLGILDLVMGIILISFALLFLYEIQWAQFH